MTDILHSNFPDDLLDMRALPNIRPVEGAWLVVDEAYAGQMAYREHLLATRRDQVLAEDDTSREAGAELLDLVLASLPEPGFVQKSGHMICPDGRVVEIDRRAPLATLGRLVQCDFCLHDKAGDEHVLRAAVLCFPAGWMLSEKLGRPLVRIHAPVEVYDAGLAQRVQRLFDGVKPDRSLWRFNRLFYDDAELFRPFSESDPRRKTKRTPNYFRAERQTILRLPHSDWVAFAIHTYVLPVARIPFAIQPKG